MGLKRDRSNIIQLFLSNNDNAYKPPPPPILSDSAPISEDEQLLNQAVANISIATYDLKNLNFQLLRLAKIMKRKKQLENKQRE